MLRLLFPRLDALPADADSGGVLERRFRRRTVLRVALAVPGAAMIP